MNKKKIKVFFKGSFYFSDSEFCLIKALQAEGIDIRYYIPIENGRLRGALLDIKKQYLKTGIYPASIYKEFDIFKDYLDLSHVFVINSPHKSNYHLLNIILKIKVLIEIYRFKPDVIHYTAPLTRPWMFLYFLKSKKILTLHDPFTHSGQGSCLQEKTRRFAFRHSDRIMMLSSENIKPFSRFYSYPLSQIHVSKLGYFDYLEKYKYDVKKESNYILFIGQVFKYKGIEYLLDAMLKVHEKHPEVNLVVAGGGKYYFDLDSYKDKSFIYIENRFIEMSRMVGLLKNCLFTVAPYTDATQSGILTSSFSLCVPIVASKVGQFQEMVRNGENGLLVEPRNVDQLAQAINRLIESPDLLDEMRNNIRKYWIPSQNWNSIAMDYISCYMS